MAERAFNKALAVALEARGYVALLPQEFFPNGQPTAAQAWDVCISNVEKCDVVVANLNGPDPDSGTCFESGYGCAKGKRVIAFRDDWRKADDLDAPVNAMLYKGEGMQYVAVPYDSVDMLAAAIDMYVKDATL